MNEDDAKGRKRLGREVRAHRATKYETVKKAVEAAGISRGAWDKVEAGEKVDPRTLALVEQALGWPIGYAADVRDDVVAPGTLAAAQAVAELQQRMTDLETQARNNSA